MICQNCNQETEGGKFCTNCGAELVNESAAAVEPTITSAQYESGHRENQNSNESVEKLKEAGSNFSHFLLTLIKKPSTAKEANDNDFISGIITIFIFSLLIAISLYVKVSSATSFFGTGPTFSKGFLLPLLQFIILFALIAILTFVGTKITAQSHTIHEVIAKYGAYLVPFLLLFAVGFLCSLLGLNTLFILATAVSLLGSILIIPGIILLEQPSNGFDQVYTLVGMSIVAIIIFAYLTRAVLGSLLGGLFGNLLNGFGF